MELHRQAFDASPDALLIVDDQGRVRRANPRAAFAFGYAQGEFVGLRIDHLLPAREVGDAFVGEGDPRRIAHHRDGSERWVDVRRSVLQGGAVLYVVRERADGTRTAGVFQSLLEAAPDAMIVVDEAGRIVLVNTQAERVFGYTRYELLGEAVELLVPERFRERHPDHRSAYFAHPGFRPMAAGLELTGLRKDGSEFPVEISLSPVRTERGTLVSSAVRDVTERREAERHLADLREKEVLLREVHHRVKNNLAIIGSMFYLQSGYTLDEGAVRILKESRERVRCMALIHETLYRSESLSDIDFGDYVSDLCRNLFATYTTIGDGSQLDLALDSVRIGIDLAIPLGLILNELVTNAMVHAYPGARKGPVAVRLARDVGGWCHLSVTDLGVGFDHPDLAGEPSSFGLRMIRSLTRQIEGSFDLRTRSPGTFASVHFSPRNP